MFRNSLESSREIQQLESGLTITEPAIRGLRTRRPGRATACQGSHSQNASYSFTDARTKRSLYKPAVVRLLTRGRDLVWQSGAQVFTRAG